MKYAKGIMWLDDCRIPFVDETEKEGVCKSDKNIKTWNVDWGIFIYNRTGGDTKGRFTPNLLVCDDMLNDGSITQGTKTKVIEGLNKGYEGWGMNKKKLVEKSDKGTNSRYYDLDKWFDKVIENL